MSAKGFVFFFCFCGFLFNNLVHFKLLTNEYLILGNVSALYNWNEKEAMNDEKIPFDKRIFELPCDFNIELKLINREGIWEKNDNKRIWISSNFPLNKIVEIDLKWDV
jgi:hypothetical protein